MIRAFAICIIGCFFIAVGLRAHAIDFEGRDYARADSIAALYPKHSLTNLKELADKLTRPLSNEVDKFRAIYKWVCSNVENDYGFYVKNKQKREKLQQDHEELIEWNRKFSQRVFRKLLQEHKTVCTGYAYLIKELAYHAGLNCKIVHGYGRTTRSNVREAGIANHSWNAIKINEQWYLCDATWSSGIVNPKRSGFFVKQFDDVYFLATPSLFARNHYPLDSSWMLLEQKPSFEAFLNGPLIYKASLSNNIHPLLPETFDVNILKGEMVTFVFDKKGERISGEVKLEINQSGNTTSVYPEVRSIENGHYAMNYLFKKKGVYVVHLVLDGAYIFSYSVRVGRPGG